MLKENLYFPANYELTDIQTGETFTSGDINGSAGYQKIFNEDEGYFRAEPYGSETDHSSSHRSKSMKGMFQLRKDASDASRTHETRWSLANHKQMKKFEGSVIVPKVH